MNPINRIGQKVVCIISQSRWMIFGCSDILDAAPKHQEIYTVVGFQTFEGSPGVHLREIGGMNCHCDGISGLPWPIAAFRPVDERKTDISALTEILHKAKKPEKV